MQKQGKTNLYIGVFTITLATLTSCTFDFMEKRSIEYNSGGLPSSDVFDSFMPDSSSSTSSTPKTSSSIGPIGNYVLKFSDEFEGNSLNEDYWNIEIGTGGNYGLTDWGNGEAQYYIKDSLTVSNGTLKITAKRENNGGKQFTSGRIQTRNHVYYTYGYFESRIKMPIGTGLWPAFWMLPNDEHIYNGWAASGEIDIMEVRGRLPYEAVTTLHYGGQWPNNKHTGKSNEIPNGGKIDEFHTYGAEWTSEYIAFYIDRKFVYKVTNATYYSTSAPNNPSAPFDVDFYLLLNFAIGGNFDGGQMPISSFTSADMEIDYVKVWQLES